MKKAVFVVWIGLLAGCVESNTSQEFGTFQGAVGNNDENNVIPRGMTAEEEARNAQDPSQGSLQAYAWECDPQTYGFTPTQGGMTLPTEGDSTTGVLLGWPSWGCVLPELTEIIRAAVGHTQVTVLVAPQFENQAKACLGRRGISDADLDLIEWIPIPVDGVWIRDFGPEILNDEHGTRRLVDMSYYPQLSNTCNNLVGRSNDDAAPTRLAANWNWPVERPQVRLEGGNLLSDGAGHCFRNARVANRMNVFSRWQYTPEQLDALLGQQYGCTVTELESLSPGVIDHIDMSVAFVSSHIVLVGQYDPQDDPVNGPIMDRNAATLASMGYDVRRIAMPAPYCKKADSTCIGKQATFVTGSYQACDHPQASRVWATYTNSIRVGDRMLVPVYHWAPDAIKARISAQEQAALQVYRVALDDAFGPGAVEVVAIPADVIIPCQGAFHCVTMTYE